VPSFESYDLAHLEFILRAASRIRRAHPTLAPLGYDGGRVVGTARGVGAGGYVVTLVGQTGGWCPFIHSYPQVFPHPQATHILWITGLRTATRRG